MPNRLDIPTGARYGRLTVLSEADARGKYRRFVCRCECGNETVVLMNDLQARNTRSCGCLHRVAGKDVAIYNGTHLRKDGVQRQLLGMKAHKTNVTGIKGVREVVGAYAVRYAAHIGIKGKKIYLGTFATIEEAAEVRRQAEELYHKPYLDAK